MKLLNIQSPSVDLVGQIEQLGITISDELQASDYATLRKALTTWVKKITIHTNQVRIQMHPQSFAKALKIDLAKTTVIELIEVMSIRRRGQELKMVIGSDTQQTPRLDPALIKLVAQAYSLRADLNSGKVTSIAEFAERHAVDHTSVKRLLPLGYLAPDIVEAILEGQQPIDLTVSALTNGYKLPILWTEQRLKLGFPAHA